MNLIESYYQVGNHLLREAVRLKEIGEHLLKIADVMSEEQMREKQPTQSSEGENHG